MLAVGATAAPAQADNFRPGARSVGDAILPQLGNGGSEWTWDSINPPAGQPPQPGPVDQFQDAYDSASDEDWDLAPAVLDHDPANLFAFFPTYVRGAMTLEGYRQIVGDERYFALAKAIQRQFAYDNVSTHEFIDFAVARSGLSGAKRALLRDYFQQWLYGTDKPTILPEAFD